MSNASFFDNIEAGSARIYNSGRQQEIQETERRLAVLRKEYADAGKPFSAMDPEVRKRLLNQFAAAQIRELVINMVVMQDLVDASAVQTLVVKRDSLKELPQLDNLPPENAILRAMKSATEDLSFVKLAKALINNMLNLLDTYQTVIMQYIENSTRLLALQNSHPEKVFDDFHNHYYKILEQHNSEQHFFDNNELAYLSGSKNLAEYLRGIEKPPEYVEGPGLPPPSYAEAMGMQAQPNPNTAALYKKLMEQYSYDPNMNISANVYYGFLARMAEVFANKGVSPNDIGQKNQATATAEHFCRPKANIWREIHKAYEGAIKKLNSIRILYDDCAKKLNQNAEQLKRVKADMQNVSANAQALMSRMPTSPEMESLRETTTAIQQDLNKPGLPPTPSAPDLISGRAAEEWDAQLLGRVETERMQAGESPKARFPNFRPPETTDKTLEENPDSTVGKSMEKTFETKSAQRGPRPSPQYGKT